MIFILGNLNGPIKIGRIWMRKKYLTITCKNIMYPVELIIINKLNMIIIVIINNKELNNYLNYEF